MKRELLILFLNLSQLTLLSSCGGGYPAEIEGLLELPEYDNSINQSILVHKGFTVSYNPDWKVPNWVAYELTANETSGPYSRENHFDFDPSYEGWQADNNDYRNSGWSRGHMVPANHLKWDSSAMKESFYYTNICPQNESLNNHDWKYLENDCCRWANKYGRVYIACGPIIYADHKTIGNGKVAVPEYFFKVVLAPVNGTYTGIGFIFKNEAGRHPQDYYARSIDEIERITGINFYFSLPDAEEMNVESTFDTKYWK